jgi:hypothetical protein
MRITGGAASATLGGTISAILPEVLAGGVAGTRLKVIARQNELQGPIAFHVRAFAYCAL